MEKEKISRFDLEAAFKALDEIDIPKVRGIRPNRMDLKEAVVRADRTSALIEDYYDLNDPEDMQDANDDREAEIAKAKLARIEKIVDLNAESKDQIQPSYVGKTIIQCPQCMTLFYKDPADIEPSEDDPSVVNVAEICQHCGNDSGYTLIGKVAEETPEEATAEEGATEEETSETEEAPEEGATEEETSEGEPAEEESSEEDFELPAIEIPEKEPEEKEEKKESFNRPTGQALNETYWNTPISERLVKAVIKEYIKPEKQELVLNEINRVRTAWDNLTQDEKEDWYNSNGTIEFFFDGPDGVKWGDDVFNSDVDEQEIYDIYQDYFINYACPIDEDETNESLNENANNFDQKLYKLEGKSSDGHQRYIIFNKVNGGAYNADYSDEELGNPIIGSRLQYRVSNLIVFKTLEEAKTFLEAMKKVNSKIDNYKFKPTEYTPTDYAKQYVHIQPINTKYGKCYRMITDTKGKNESLNNSKLKKDSAKNSELATKNASENSTLNEDWVDPDDYTMFITIDTGDGSDYLRYIGYDYNKAYNAVDAVYPDWTDYGLGGDDTEPVAYAYTGNNKAAFDKAIKEWKLFIKNNGDNKYYPDLSFIDWDEEVIELYRYEDNEYDESLNERVSTYTKRPVFTFKVYGTDNNSNILVETEGTFKVDEVKKIKAEMQKIMDENPEVEHVFAGKVMPNGEEIPLDHLTISRHDIDYYALDDELDDANESLTEANNIKLPELTKTTIENLLNSLKGQKVTDAQTRADLASLKNESLDYDLDFDDRSFNRVINEALKSKDKKFRATSCAFTPDGKHIVIEGLIKDKNNKISKTIFKCNFSKLTKTFRCINENFDPFIKFKLQIKNDTILVEAIK